MARQRTHNAICKLSSARETQAERSLRLANRRDAQRSAVAGHVTIDAYDPSRFAPRVSKRKFQQTGGEFSGTQKLGHERNPRSAQAHADQVQAFIDAGARARAKIAAKGRDVKFMHSMARQMRGLRLALGLAA